MFIIGLTGCISTGKSTVARYLKQLEIPVIDMDLVAREVVEPGTLGLQKLVSEFGEEILMDEGTLKRAALGELIFNNEVARQALNNILHPLIFQAAEAKRENYRKQGKPLIVMDIPLLYETSDLKDFDEVWVVYVPEEIQLQRLMKRDSLNVQEAKARIASQMSIEEKKMIADVVIDNSGSIEATQEQVRQQLKRYIH